MDSIIAELTNLANGSIAAGDPLAAKICIDAIKELRRLQVVAWYIWEGEGRGGFSDPEACKLIGVSNPSWEECMKVANTEGQDNGND